jgi:uncharacterized membrane protein (DUF373 family)
MDPLDHEVFQMLFGMVITLLIALEFKHSIIRVALRRSSIVQVKTVVLISLIALSRKFVILDTHTTNASTIAALAGATLLLGVVYWLLRERDDRVADGDDGQVGHASDRDKRSNRELQGSRSRGASLAVAAPPDPVVDCPLASSACGRFGSLCKVVDYGNFRIVARTNRR